MNEASLSRTVRGNIYEYSESAKKYKESAEKAVDIASLEYFPEDANCVKVKCVSEWNTMISLDNDNGHLDMSVIEEDKAIYLQSGEFPKGERNKGRAGDWLISLIHKSNDAGIETLQCFAAGSYENKQYNGYYTWARYGFDGPIPEQVAKTAKVKFPEATMVSHIKET